MANPAQADPNAETPEQLEAAVYTSYEAALANPTDETKAAAKAAREKFETVRTKAKTEAEAKAKTEKDERAKLYPDKYELKVPDGVTMDAPAVERIAAFAKAQGLSQTQAQAMLEREAQVVASVQEANQTLLETKQKEWLETAKTDKEIGGDQFPKNSELSKRVVARYGSEALKTSLNDSGLGDHPELIRMLVRIGKAMTEDQLVLPGSGTNKVEKSAAETLYDNPNSK